MEDVATRIRLTCPSGKLKRFASQSGRRKTIILRDLRLVTLFVIKTLDIASSRGSMRAQQKLITCL